MSDQPSTSSALITLLGFGLLIIVALAMLFWVFNQSGADEATAGPTPTPTPAQGTDIYNIDDQLDQL